MARSSNALWIGAIVIVAALTAVELMSSRENSDTSGSADSTSITGTAPSANPIATGAISESPSGSEESDTSADLVMEFDPSTLQAPNLVIDLDNREHDLAHVEDDLIDNTQALEHSAEKAKQQVSATKAESDTATDLLVASVSEPAATNDPESVNTLSPIDLKDKSTGTVEIPETTAATPSEIPVEPEQIPHTHAISQHMAEAEQAIKELRLTTPEGNSAYEHYQAVLALDANHAAAQAGLQKIVDMYIYFVEKAIADDKSHTAKVYLQRAESLQPGSAKLKALRAELQ